MRLGVLAACLASAAFAPAAAEPLAVPEIPADAQTGSDAFAGVGDFAWRAFVALNWPAATAGERGEPDRARRLGDPGPRVWETFKSAAEAFPVGADGRRLAPAPWNSYAGPAPCAGDNREKIVAAFEPFAEFNQPGFSDAPANALVAQNGEYVRYEVRYNAQEFAAFAARGWSEGRHLPDAAHPAPLPVGSLAVKAAWRPLNAADPPEIRERYYVARAAVVDIEKSRAAGRIVCSPRDLALVGLHIAVKTRTRPQWIWASFEHADNVPPAGAEPDAAREAAPYGFFDPARPARLWPPFGAPATQAIDRENPPRLAPEPMQIVRRHPINASLMAVNRAYQALPEIAASVWRRYMLVAAQWPTSAEAPSPENDGAYFPGQAEGSRDESYKAAAAAQENLVNTTMETYMQEAPASCMSCHHAVSNQNGFDFVGGLARLR